jgi:hypothetical protein
VSPSNEHRSGPDLTEVRRRGDELKRQSDELERRSDELGRKADEVRQDWRRKRADPGVPGAVPEDRDGPGGESPEGRNRGKSEDLDEGKPSEGHGGDS